MDVPAAPAGVPAEAIRAVPLRHWGRWVAGAVILAVVAWLVSAAVDSNAVHFPTVRRFLFNDTIVEGLRNTLLISVLAQAVGVLLGVGFAVMRLSTNPVLSVSSWVYVWLFRGTPVLVQLIFWFSLPLVFQNLTNAIPLVDVTLYQVPMVEFMTPFKAAFLGLALNEGAYMAEIVRAGVLSVDVGQVEASQALGMRSSLTMRRIVLPQAMRVIIPPTGNEFVSMLKTSSLASVVLYPELLRRAQDIYSSNLRTLELLVVASIWYLVLTSVASVGQYYLERRFARGSARELPETALERVWRNLTTLGRRTR
ncbi:MAG: amino acid ABC transporter permease [Actinomycetota bacterium]|nr:amino acid ABC transporter permease [Actinomycetota bacterium]